jgi:hypothetical protein
MASDADMPDEQDQAEAFDEDIMGDEGLGPSPDMRVFEELPDVYDVTSRVGDADVTGDLDASDADEIDDDELDELDLDDDDGEDDDTLDDDLEDLPEDDEVFDDDEDLNEVDGLDELEDDEIEIESVGDVDDAGDEDEVSDYESEDELSDEDVAELGYSDPAGEEDAEEAEEEDEAEDGHGPGLVPGGPGKTAQGHSGEAADMAADRVHKHGAAELTGEERQDNLLDEGVEETFPASDPVSVKRIT